MIYDVNNIAFRDIAIVGNNGWFFNIGYNAIMRLDLNTGEVNVEAFLPFDKWGEFERYSSIDYFNGKLYIAPRKASNICIFSLENKEFEFLELDLEKYCDQNTNNMFNTVKAINGNIYFFPGRFHAIVKLNPKNHKVEYIDGWYKDLEQIVDIDNDIFIFNRIHENNQGNYIMPCWRLNIAITINVVTGKYEYIDIEDDGAFSDLAEINDTLLYAKKCANLKIKKGDLIKEIITKEENNGWYIHSGQEMFCAIPFVSDEILFINACDMEVSRSIVCDDTVKTQEWLEYKHLSICNKLINKNELFIYLNRSNQFLRVNLSSLEIEKVQLYRGRDTKQRFKENMKKLLLSDIHNENNDYSLKSFVASI